MSFCACMRTARRNRIMQRRETAPPSAASPDRLADWAAQLHRDGFLILPGVLTEPEVGPLAAALERAFMHSSADATAFGMDRSWRPRMFEEDPLFEALIDREPVAGLMEALLGSDCHLIAMNAMRTEAGQEISKWHADDEIRLPLPPGLRLDPAMTAPCDVVSVNYYLTDVDVESGGTEFIPRSHRAGRQPAAADFDATGYPVFEGEAVVCATGPRGTAVLWNDQIWHRGGLNRTRQRRLVQQVTYGRRYMAQRFYPFVAYQPPSAIVARAGPRRRRLLGLHGHGAYG